VRDYINQLALEGLQDGTFLAEEGFVRGAVLDPLHGIHNHLSTLKGWVEGVSKKKTHINEIADDTIEWLKEEDKDNPRLSLDMDSFKTWMKTSEVSLYRYYYVLLDPMYDELVRALKKGEISELEEAISHYVDIMQTGYVGTAKDAKDRKSATRMLDSARTIKDLIVLVEKYRARVNTLFELLEKRDRSVNGFPFQLMLSGMNDLRQTVKKIVNLAV
jgi:hypothetical protein